MLERCVNKLNLLMEILDYQTAAALLGLPAEITSDTFLYFNSAAAIALCETDIACDVIGQEYEHREAEMECRVDEEERIAMSYEDDGFIVDDSLDDYELLPGNMGREDQFEISDEKDGFTDTDPDDELEMLTEKTVTQPIIQMTTCCQKMQWIYMDIQVLLTIKLVLVTFKLKL